MLVVTGGLHGNYPKHRAQGEQGNASHLISEKWDTWPGHSPGHWGEWWDCCNQWDPSGKSQPNYLSPNLFTYQRGYFLQDFWTHYGIWVKGHFWTVQNFLWDLFKQIIRTWLTSYRVSLEEGAETGKGRN